MIDVDGSQGEGGGQILRTSLALASVLGKDIRVHGIRAGRSQPGIKAQHLTGLRALAQLCGSSLEGADVGSSELVYEPGELTSGGFHFDVGTAGSVTLVLQTLMPVVAYCPGPVRFELTGGTDVKWSPPVNYLQLIALPMLRRMGYIADLRLVRRGHYPRGGGEVHLDAAPIESLKHLVGVRSGRVVGIDGVSHVTMLPHHVAERQAIAARNLVMGKGLPSPDIGIEDSQSDAGVGPGSGLVLRATREETVLGADSLGEKGKPAEVVGEEAGKRLVEEVESDAFLDRHMADIVVPYIALADGVSDVSVSQITQHTLTNVMVAELLSGVRFDVKGKLGEPGVLRVKGLGFKGASSSSTRPVVSPRP